MTPTAVGLVLAEGHSADGTILDHRELALRGGGGVGAAAGAEQIAAEVARVSAAASDSGHRLRVVGVTWSDDASAQAALLLELLSDAGLDNVVPVRQLDAFETLALAITPVIGYQRTAVCLLEQDQATLVAVDTQGADTQRHDNKARTAVQHVSGGLAELTAWLTGMFESEPWRPEGVVVVGSDSSLHASSRDLENALPVPVFTQSMAQVTIARGTALAAARSTEFTDSALLPVAPEPAAAPDRSARRSYAGAAATLAAAAVTFVASVSLALGIQLAPKEHTGTAKHAGHTSTPQVAQAVAPSAP